MAFPTTSVLDNFNRADATPPSANWTQGVWRANGLRLVSNVVSGVGGSAGDAYWNPGTFGPDCEVFGTQTLNKSIEVYLRLANPGAGTADGYYASPNPFGSGAQIWRLDNGVATQLGANGGSSSISSGAKLGLKAAGSDLSCYADTGGGWALELSRTDSTYSAAGYIALGGNSSEMDDFGGGTVVVPNFPTTSVLDNFNRANEGPPPSASWTTDWYYNPTDGLRVASNIVQVAGSGTGDGWWDLTTFGPNSEAYATFSYVVGALVLGVRLTTPSATGATTDGYALKQDSFGGDIFRIDNASLTQLGASFGDGAVDGDKYGIEAVGSDLKAYENTGTGWSSLVTRTDSTYSAAGYIGMGLSLSTAVADDFGGGTVTIAWVPETNADETLRIVASGRRW